MVAGFVILPLQLFCGPFEDESYRVINLVWEIVLSFYSQLLCLAGLESFLPL